MPTADDAGGTDVIAGPACNAVRTSAPSSSNVCSFCITPRTPISAAIAAQLVGDIARADRHRQVGAHVGSARAKVQAREARAC